MDDKITKNVQRIIGRVTSAVDARLRAPSVKHRKKPIKDLFEEEASQIPQQ